MNDYVELQKIYEGYPGAFDPIKPGNYYPAKQDHGPYSRPIPGTPEASGYSQYRQNQVSPNTVTVIDEEIPAAEIIYYCIKYTLTMNLKKLGWNMLFYNCQD